MPKLIVDNDDTYQDESDVFLTSPQHMGCLKVVKPQTFDSALIQNAHVDDLSAFALTQLFTVLKMGARATIVITQPVLVMQDYDVKQVEANARLAGFEDISVSETTFVEPKSGKELTTQQLDLVKTENEDSGTKVKTTKQTVVTTTTTKTESRRRK
jgi:hypothetical protein